MTLTSKYLDVEAVVDDDVFVFHVAVQDAGRVQVQQGTDQLSRHEDVV